jgi:hypothetical protein
MNANDFKNYFSTSIAEKNAPVPDFENFNVNFWLSGFF